MQLDLINIYAKLGNFVSWYFVFRITDTEIIDYFAYYFYETQ